MSEQKVVPVRQAEDGRWYNPRWGGDPTAVVLDQSNAPFKPGQRVRSKEYPEAVGARRVAYCVQLGVTWKVVYDDTGWDWADAVEPVPETKLVAVRLPGVPPAVGEKVMFYGCECEVVEVRDG